MSVFKKTTYYLGSCYYFLREKIAPSKIREGREIPIVINNFNRLSCLRKLIDALTARGYTNIYILDNASTYPPLLEYYKSCPFKVFNLQQNLGFKALWKSPLRKRFCGDYYIYTDSDVVPADYCPADFIDYFLRELKRHPLARKIGFSLRIDNLPDCYAHKEKVIALEKRYYKHLSEKGLYRAPIDTTFALYRPRVGLSRSRSAEAYRTAYPYQAEHLPWYSDSSNLPEEEQYYIAHCTHVTEWSSKSKKTGTDKL
ncbi:glycosyltransferase family 2 protein [Parabacteroides sp.]